MRAVPTESRRFWPPESRNGCWSRSCSSPKRRSMRIAFCAIGLGDAVHAQAQLELAEGAVRDELVLGVLEHEADAARERSSIGAGGVEAEHVDGSGGRRDDAGDRLQERGLARAVGADDRDEFAGGDVEVDIVHDDRPPPAAPAAPRVRRTRIARSPALASPWIADA